MSTFKILGSFVNDPSANNIGSATTVRVVATGGTVTGTVNLADDTKIGEFYLHAAGDEITISKDPTDKITSATSHAHAVSVTG
jgi:phage-related protein